jgi:hypothetical protein
LDVVEQAFAFLDDILWAANCMCRFEESIWRTTKKSNNIRTAASFSLTVGLDPGKSSIQATTWNGRTDVSQAMNVPYSEIARSNDQRSVL